MPALAFQLSPIHPWLHLSDLLEPQCHYPDPLSWRHHVPWASCVLGHEPHRLVGERRQDDGLLHGVHHQLPELLQHTLQNRLLTDFGKQGEAGGEAEVRERGHHPRRTGVAQQGELRMLCAGKADSGALEKMPGPHGEGGVVTECSGKTWQDIQI